MLSQEALAFVERLHRELNPERERLLAVREARRGSRPRFVRAPEEFTVAPAPADLQDRRVEITGPVERKMMINALNSGAKVFMADFEDANSPTWAQRARRAAQRARRGAANDRARHAGEELPAERRDGDARHPAARLAPRRAPPLVDGAPVSASLFDFGLRRVQQRARAARARDGAVLLSAEARVARGGAALGAARSRLAEDELGLPHGSIKCTVLIETILAAFEMDAILYELREHSCALNAGRWDYIFSCIKKLGAVLPDRAQVTMTVPFMRAYTELLVQTCHDAGARTRSAAWPRSSRRGATRR